MCFAMVRAVCPLCGNSTDILIEGLCPNCFREKHPLASQKREVRLQRCRVCGAYKLGGSPWIRDPGALEEELKRRAKTFLSFNGRVIETRMHLRLHEGVLEVEVRGIAHGLASEPYWERLLIPLRVQETVCDSCFRHLAKGAAAIVQIRAMGRELTKSEREAIEEALSELARGGRETSADRLPLKVEERSHGLDIHFATYAAAREFTKLLAGRLYFDLLETSKLVGVSRSGREKHKHTLRLLLPGFKEGDVVEYEGQPCVVDGIRSGKALLTRLADRGRLSIPLTRSTIAQIRVLAAHETLERAVVVSRYGETVHVMDPLSNTLVEIYVRDPGMQLAPGQSVTLYRHGDSIYLVSVS